MGIVCIQSYFLKTAEWANVLLQLGSGLANFAQKLIVGFNLRSQPKHSGFR